MEKDIELTIRNILSEVLVRTITEEEFGNGENLVERLSIDSLSGLQIIIKMEQSFQIIIEDDDYAIQLINSVSLCKEFIKEQDIIHNY